MSALRPCRFAGLAKGGSRPLSRAGGFCQEKTVGVARSSPGRSLAESGRWFQRLDVGLSCCIPIRLGPCRFVTAGAAERSLH